MKEKEIWIEHPVGVKVSNLGRVYWESSKYPNGHFTYGWKNNYGYKQVGYKGKQYLVHRLIAECFLLNPDKLPMVNHIDENKTNNNVKNLEWCDAKYNNTFGTGPKRRAEKRSKKVLQMTLDGKVVKEWASTQECGRNGFEQSPVSACCNNKFNREGNNVYKGFIWKYA